MNRTSSPPTRSLTPDLNEPKSAHGRRAFAAAFALCAAAGLAPIPGCASDGPSISDGAPYSPRTLDARDRLGAEELCDQAEPLMGTDPARAELLLLDALTADVYSGRAHNNLGVLFLARGDLYSAAAEFEAARKLLPDNPDPRINLGLVFEQAGQIDQALNAYAAAHDLNPNHLGAIQALARAQLRHHRADDRTPDLLGQIALRGDENWRHWAIGHIEQLR